MAKQSPKSAGKRFEVWGFASGNGDVFGIALKVLDGNQRCSPIATMAVLGELDLLTKDQSEKLSSYKKTVLKNHRKIETGIITVEL